MASELIKVLIRTIFFYFYVLIMFRIMGKREVGQLGIIDLVVSILVAELMAISIENIDKPIWNTILPIAELVLLELSLAFISLKSKKVRTFLGGKPSIIIDRGKVNYKEMVHQRYTVDDLLFELRQKGIKSIESIDYALLESNGKLSIFEKKKFDKSYPLPLIVDGQIQTNTLKRLNKSKVWLEYMIKRNNLSTDDIFYCFYKGYKLYIIRKSDLEMLS